MPHDQLFAFRTMIEGLLVVLSDPAGGREDEFNDWYSHVHVRDTMRFRGSIAAQRFRRSDAQAAEHSARYLALYEVFDAARFAQEHFDNASTKRMIISDAIDLQTASDYFYFLLHYRCRDPLAENHGSVVLEQLSVKPGQEGAFEEYYCDSYLPSLMREGAFANTSLLAWKPPGQLLEAPPAHLYVGVHRLVEGQAGDRFTMPDHSAIDAGKTAVSRWTPHSPRLTEDDVHHPTAAGLAEEERVRAAIGDRFHRNILA